MTDTPVTLLLFNRPDLTARAFAAVRRARPRTLLLVADGPRPHVPTDVANCAAARAAVADVDWPCDVRRNFADVNLGCRDRVSSGLDWAFGQVPESIVLEDDCLPDESFFPYCRDLLDRYRDDGRVMAISGDNFQPPGRVYPGDYYFSRYPHVWGWATWRRAWRHYDVGMARWPALRAGGWLAAACPTPDEAAFWRWFFDAVHGRQVDTWDVQWVFACWAAGGVAALPAVNLVSNVGFRSDATHTFDPNGTDGLAAGSLTFPLSHPPAVTPLAEADAHTFQTVFRRPPPAARRRLSRRAVDLVRRAVARLGR